VSSRTAPYD